MSKATEVDLYEALAAHLRDEEALEANELLTGWVVAYCAELPAEPDAARYGHSSPDGQRYHISHGLAAGLMAAFNNGVGTPNDGTGE
jgi:hypothetical protein